MSLVFSRFPLQSFKIGKLNSPITPGVHVLRKTMITGKTRNKKHMADASLFYSIIICTLKNCLGPSQLEAANWGYLQHSRITVPGCRAGLARPRGENSPCSAQCRKCLPYTGCQHPKKRLPPAQVLPVALQFGRALLELHNQALIFLLASRWLCFSQTTPSLSHFVSPFSTIPLVKVKPI